MEKSWIQYLCAPANPSCSSRYLSRREEECLSERQVFWPADRQCHTLLHQGPCQEGQWLVLEEGRGAEVDIVCRERPCPCTTKGKAGGVNSAGQG